MSDEAKTTEESKARVKVFDTVFIWTDGEDDNNQRIGFRCKEANERSV